MGGFVLQKDILLEHIIVALMSCQYSFAVWRNPLEKTMHGFASPQSIPLENPIHIEASKPCFIFSPFCKDENHYPFQICNDFSFHIKEDNTIEIEVSPELPTEKKTFLCPPSRMERQKIYIVLSLSIQMKPMKIFFKHKKSTSQKYYKNIVQKEWNVLKKNIFKK